MLLEIEDLKNELQSQEGLKNHEMSEERVACSFTVEEFLQELEEVKRKHLAEKQILSHELTTLRVEKEKWSRVQTEFKKLETADIAGKLEDMQVSDQYLAQCIMKKLNKFIKRIQAETNYLNTLKQKSYTKMKEAT